MCLHYHSEHLHLFSRYCWDVSCRHCLSYYVLLPLKANIYPTPDQVAAHFGMITAVHVNPSPSKYFKHLTLTSSVDWTIKLWDASDISLSSTPLLEFTAPTFEYFCSVRWSHIHPGVFSCITSGLCMSVVHYSIAELV